jgi:hypothetical protein
MWVRTLRKVYTPGGLAPAGADLNLPHDVAALLIGAGKAHAIPAPPAPAPVAKPAKPVKPPPAPALTEQE